MSRRQINTTSMEKEKSFTPNPTELENSLKRVRDDEENVPVKKSKSILDFSSSEESPSSPSWLGSDSPYAPTSPKYCSHSQQEEDSSEESSFVGEFFQQQGQIPFHMDEKTDCFLLDPDRNDAECFKNYDLEEKNAKMCGFARSIATFKNGTIVSKHSRPYGQSAVLYNKKVRILQKVYNDDSHLVFVTLKAIDEPHREYCIQSRFFASWMDADCLQAYQKFVTK